MKRMRFLAFFLVFLAFVTYLQAQTKRRTTAPVKRPTKVVQNAASREVGTETNAAKTAIVVDERLAVLRTEPSLYAKPIQRMRRGRVIPLLGTREADGVTFYRVVLGAESSGWVQREAVIEKTRRGDDERLARLVYASEGFDQIERAVIFLDSFPKSTLRPAMLLLFGDLIEGNAAVISRDAGRRLNRREMSGSGAPVYSFYLNYSGLDRYRRLSIGFVFNSATAEFHYDGAAWKEILAKFPNAAEAVEARKRLETLKEKLAKKP